MPPEMMAAVAIALGLCVTALVVALRCRVRVPPGSALVIHRVGSELRVSFSDAFVIPVVSRAEAIDCTVKSLTIARVGAEGLRCRDKIRVEMRVEFKLAVNRTVEDVIEVARSIGAARAADPATLRDLFEAKFVDNLAAVVGLLEFDELTERREQFRDEVIQTIGTDLGGYQLVDVAILGVEQTPIEQLDPHNVHDAEAIRRIHERVAEQARRTQQIRLEERREAALTELQAHEVELEVQRQLEARTRR